MKHMGEMRLVGRREQAQRMDRSYYYVIHWYEHRGHVPLDEVKTKGMKMNE